ncbi:MAG: metalloregulator ArsR/SmtB family transcription factor [Rhodospirillales bacterium]|jgi:ArsR family transcriptional regulator|nr:metalloregulator ArsR/SmtB family transcription factor [Rhodospirillales bacterium]
MSSEGPKYALLSQFAAVAKALGHPHRLELLEFAAQGERSVDSLAGRAGLTVGNASQHLQNLRRAGLVKSRREGKRVLYRLSDDAVVGLLASVRQIAERNLAEVQRVLDGYFHERDALEPVSRDELAQRMHDGLVTVLDVRPEDEFAAGHLPGAINIPLRELEKQLADLPRDHEIVAYCRGPYCVLSFEAVSALRERGFKVRRFEEGYPEWRAAGLAVETTDGSVG